MDNKEFEDFLRGIEFRGAVKRQYTEQEKRELLTKAAPLILGGTPIQMVAAIIVVPYETLFNWVRRINSEGLSSLEDKKKRAGEDGYNEMFKAVEWIKQSGLKPTPSRFVWAVHSLKLKRKSFTLYLYYRRYIKQSKEEENG